MEVYRIEGYPQKNGKLAGIAMMSYTIIHVYIYIYIRTTHMGPTTKKTEWTKTYSFIYHPAKIVGKIKVYGTYRTYAVAWP